MNHPLGRRAATAAATLAVTVGALLAVGGTASAASGPVVAVTHSSSAAQYGDPRYDDRAEHIRYDDRDHVPYDGQGDRIDHDHCQVRVSRWDGNRTWYCTGGDWYGNDYGRQYRYDRSGFYMWDHGTWDTGTGDVPCFDYCVFF